MATKQGNSPKRKPAAPARKRREKTAEMDRRWSILLFGVGLLLTFLAVIPGESGWAWLRGNILFGAFGLSGWVIGPLFIWWAVLVGLDKPVLAWIIRGILLLFAVSGFAMVFSGKDFTELGFGELLKAVHAYATGHVWAGGITGLLLGGTLLALGGRVVARILMVLVLLLAVMVFTGKTPGDIVRFVQEKLADRPPRPKKERAPRPVAVEADDPPFDMVDENGGAIPLSELDYQLAAGGRQPKPRRGGKQVVRGGPPPMRMAPAAAPQPRGRRVDIDLGPDNMTSAPGPAAVDATDVKIGPGGTFGANPLHQPAKLPQNGNEDEIDLVFDFSRKYPIPAAFDEERPNEETPLLFGDDDPLAAIGGPDSRLRDANLPPIEFVPREAPAPAPEFDLFHNPASAGKGAPDAPAPSAPLYSSPPAPAPDVEVDDVDDASLWYQGEEQEVESSLPDVAPQAAVPGPAAEAPPAVPAAEPVRQSDPEVDRLIQDVEQKRQADEAAAPVAAVRHGDQNYRTPPVSLFNQPQVETDHSAREEMSQTADLLVGTLESFGVKTRILHISRGPSVTRYEIQPQAGVKISKITNLADDIALNLSAAGVRIEAPIPGKPAVGIEVPNKVKSTVAIRGVIESSEFAGVDSPLPIALGKDIAGDCVVADLSKMPHLLIAGSTGSGKSVCVNATIMSFLYRSTPEQMRLLLIDPKVVELAEYNGIPHLLMPVVTEPRKAAGALGSAVAEMEKRYHTFAENNVRDIRTYNKMAAREGLEHMPYIAIVIDELADLMMTAGKEVEDYICRIAQKARAAGMHLIVATQRPSVDVITGLIKANIPSRIAFAVSSQVDSRTILDGGGAEKLLGMGDMLFMPVGANKPVRVQGTYVRDSEISSVLDYIKSTADAQYDEDMIQEMERRAAPEQQDDEEGDTALFKDATFISAVETALEAGQISTSFLQRRLRLGYARAGRIVDEMEKLHIVSPPDGSKPRQVLISREQWLEMSMNASG